MNKEVGKPYSERIKRGGRYYSIEMCRCSGIIYDYFYYDRTVDKMCIEIGNFFETEQEAQEKLDEILKLLKGEY